MTLSLQAKYHQMKMNYQKMNYRIKKRLSFDYLQQQIVLIISERERLLIVLIHFFLVYTFDFEFYASMKSQSSL